MQINSYLSHLAIYTAQIQSWISYLLSALLLDAAVVKKPSFKQKVSPYGILSGRPYPAGTLPGEGHGIWLIPGPENMPFPREKHLDHCIS